MKNPFGPDQESFHSYVNLKQRMLSLVQAGKVYDRIFQIVQKAYEDALKSETIILTRAEQKHLFSQILRLMLEDMIKKLDSSSHPS